MIIGIDVGMRIENPSAYVVLDGMQDAPGWIVAYGEMAPAIKGTKTNWLDRCCQVADHAGAVVAAYVATGGRIDAIVVERPYVEKSVDVAIKLATLQGMLFLACRSYAPQALLIQAQPQDGKQALTGDRRADKQAMQQMAARVGLRAACSSHEADALGIALYGYGAWKVQCQLMQRDPTAVPQAPLRRSPSPRSSRG